MTDATAGRPDSPAQYGKPPPAGGVPSGLPRPLSSSSSLGLGFEDGQSHGNGSNSGFGAHHIAPAMNGSLSGAGGSENPRSLITWDSFNSTDFNALKSAVGLANVSAAFAWQSPPALASHGAAPSGDSAFTAAAPFPPGASAAAMSGPAAVPMNGFLGSRGAADATGATAGMHSSGSGSPYGGSLAAGLAAGMPPLLGDALPPLAAPPGLATSFQQRQLHSPQPGRTGVHGGFGHGAAAQPQLHRYLSEPPGGVQLAAAAAGLLDGPGGGSLHGGMHSSRGRGGGGLSPEPASPFTPPALHRHSMGSAPFAAMSLPEGHAASFPQSLPGPTLQHPGGLSGGFSFRSSPQLLGSMAQQRMQQPPSPGALSLASAAPGSPGAALGLQGGTPPLPRGQQQQQQQQWPQHHHYHQQQQDEAQPLHSLLQQQQGHSQPPPRPALPPRRTVSFDGGAGASHVAGARGNTRPGFVHSRAGFSHLDQQQQQQQQRQQQQQQRQQPGFGCADLGRSSSFADFAPPAPYQPAGLRRHVSMNSSLGPGLAALPHQQQPPSPMLGGYGGGGGPAFGAALGSPHAGGSLHGGYGPAPPSPAAPQHAGRAQFGCSSGGGGFGGDDLSAVHRRARSADFGTPPRRGGRGAQGQNGTGRNGGGRAGFGGRGVSPAREVGPNGDAGYSYSRGSGGSGHASPQVLSRSTSGAGLAARGVGSPTVGDGPGYRQLWAQVTGMQGGDAPAAGEETTVEDLLRVVKQLPPDAEAAPVVARGLHHLDSRALAALLKELAKAGVPARASEIFDWLRGLPGVHPLSALCDVYTYTTIIAQCGTGQGLGTALALAAEMRSRGIALNCHAFSALMNVCIKAGELELALDVFQQLLREGCTPNLVTYNILIDIYSKTGQWEDAVKVLDTLQAQGTAPEVRTYNTVIGACSRAGQPGAAAGVYRRMLADGAAPTATTATALVSVFARAGQVDEALAVLQDMAGRGAERSPVAYGALVAAAEKAARPALALQLFDDMLRALLKPSAATFAAALAACAQSGRWERALEIFELLRSRGCKPDGGVFASLLTALAAGGQWQRSLQAFSRLQAAGVRPGPGHHAALVEALWGGGGLPPQARALAHVDAALASGALSGPVPDGGNSGDECMLGCAVPGAAAAAALHWLLLGPAFRGGRLAADAPTPGHGTLWCADGGDSRVRGGEAASAGLAAAAPLGSPQRISDASLPALGCPSADGRASHDSGGSSRSSAESPAAATVLLLALREPAGPAGTAAGGPAAAAEEAATQLHALLAGLRAPVDVAIVAQGIRLEARPAAVRDWLAGSAAAPAVALAAAAAAAGGAHEALIEADADRDARCRRALRAVQEFESRDCIRAEAFASEAAAAARRGRLAALAAAAAAARLPPEVAADAAQLADRAVSLAVAADGEGLAAAVLLLAAPQAGRPLTAEALATALPGSGDEIAVAAAAQQLANGLRRCKAGCGAVSALRVLALLQERLGADSQDAAAAAWVAGPAAALLAAAAGDTRLLRFRGSDAAAAALALGRNAAGAVPPWPLCLASLTGHADPTSGPLAAIAAVLHEAQHNVQKQQQQQQQQGSAAGLPVPPSAADSGAPGTDNGAFWHKAALPALTTSVPASPARHNLSPKLGPACVRASGSGGSSGAQSGVHMVSNGISPDGSAPPCGDGIDGGLTAEDVARLQRRLADFGVSD